METDRRRFLNLTLTAASASVLTGCVGGDGTDGDEGDGTGGDGGDEPAQSEPAEFGYETWVPTGEYSNIGYADLSRLREHGSLETDAGTARVAGDAGPNFADVDAYISTAGPGVFGATETDGNGGDAFDAYHGSFDAEALTSEITDQLSEPEETESNGYTVLRGTETDEQGEPTDETVEAVVSDSFVIASKAEERAVRVLEAALGETEREADTTQGGELIQGLDEYADDPSLVIFNYGTVNTKYSFVETRDGVLKRVDVAVQRDAETARNVSEEYNKYNDTDITATVEGRTVIIVDEVSLRDVETYFSDAGRFP